LVEGENMKHKKLIVSLICFILIFVIYLMNVDKKINYIALGDSLAKGQNPYGEISYGYADYVANYLERNDLLKFYTKEYAQSGARSKDLKEDIENNKKIDVDGKERSIKVALRQADLVTVSIGANDFLSQFNLKNIDLEFFKLEKLKEKIDPIYKNVDETLKEIRKYAKNDIIVIGYYNPLPRATALFKDQIDELFKEVNKMYREICNKYDMYYIDLYSLFQKNQDFLPNPIDIHPNSKGYEAISREIIDILEQKVLN